jgi:hypothetical protein
VQNAIDAGSTDIRVDIARDAEGALLFSVSDAGEGMDRDILENKLLVLFRSGKEGVEGKIGKFGIGFVSVLAIKPSVVKVQSTRAGKGHTLHLYADHSYELFEHPPAAPGTTVTLVVPVPKQKADARVKEHVQRSRVSLLALVRARADPHPAAGGRERLRRRGRGAHRPRAAAGRRAVLGARGQLRRPHHHLGWPPRQ